ncbi:nucleotidyltransferase family protein [Niallia taxi]|uniref:nucleotidyltransferase domain-containing protein n=1 Tax=Niallia taxi TaxID=2499688 RepID=UPI002E1BCB1A|nr:nucleotidyltransferase family protein [Niallia taxi]
MRIMKENKINFLTQLPLEMNLLLDLLEANFDVLKINSYSKADINWKKFLQLAKHHRVIPLLYSKLQKNGSTWIPESVMSFLQNKYRQNVFSMLQLTQEMDSIGRMLNKNNIRALFLKGPILGKDLYGDIGLRSSKDLDILIPSHEFQNVQELLMKHGYIERKEKTCTILKEERLRTHHAEFFHPNSRFSIEIHWRLNDLPDKEPSFTRLWERRRVSQLTTEPLYYLGEEDLFCYLISHGARHGWFRLRWLVDIDKLLRKGIDWEKYRNVMLEYSNEHVIGQSLILAQGLLKSPLNKQSSYLLTRKAEELAHWAMIYIKSIEYDQPFPKDLIPYNKYNLVLQKNIIQKTKYLLILSYPTYKDYQIFQLPKILHFLYFPLRPVLYTGRKLGLLKINENI